jgi:CDP-diacylglycerol--serine O-phosphatidyltransferase
MLDKMDLKKTLFIVPNLLTSASLLCGVLAILYCVNPEATGEDIYNSTMFLFYAFLFDLFDGRVARMTRTQSSFGVEFDSLADLISFGVAPAVITYRWALTDCGIAGVVVCFVYVLAGAIRLARFNVMARTGTAKKAPSGKYMLGLPIPIAAGFIAALVVAARAMGGWPWPGFTVEGIRHPMLVVMVFLAFLMVSSIRFRSFKDLKLNTFTISLLVVTLVSGFVFWFKSKPAYILIWLLCLYVAIGFAEAIIFWPRRRKERMNSNNQR